jgi:uncharacterized protein YjdB
MMRKQLSVLMMGIMLTLTGCASLAAAGTQPGQIEVSGNDVDASGTSQEQQTGIDASENEETTTQESETEEPIEKIPVEGISFSNTRLKVLKGETFTMDVTLYPENTNTSQKINWSSMDPTIVMADTEGKLHAVSGGTTLVLARIGVLTAVCQVTVEAPLQGIVLQDLELEYSTGTTYELNMSTDPVDTTDEIAPVYSSDDTSVVAVDPQGGLHTVGTGTAHITVSVGDFEETCTVQVVAHLKKITFSEEELTIDIGKSKKLSVKLSPTNTTDEPELQYKSSAPEVAAVDEDGKVTALSAGSAQITVSAGKISATCTVSVNVPLEGISVPKKQLQLQKGATAKLETELLPENTTETPQIAYVSSNPAVATVDDDGTISAVGAGTAVIYANTGAFSDNCTVQVLAPLQSIALDKTDVTMWAGENTTLSVLYNPGDTTDDRTVQWTSSNPAVASVSGGVVQALSDGTCTITGTVSGKSASCIVRVSTFYHVTGISLNETQITLDTVGATRQLTAGIAPANATNPAVTYASSNGKVASVSSTGLVTAVSGGSAVITATADGVTASCIVTVNLPQAQKVIVLDPGHGGVDPGAGYNGLVEKEMTLKVAFYCKAYLEEHYSGAVVLMTRTTDTQLTRDETGTDLRARCTYAASVGADVMVSLHFNSVASHASQGALALISKQPSVTVASASLANSILAQLQALGIANRGPLMTASDTLFDANGALDYYAINRICANYGIPGIIVEHCFMDNASDMTFCDSEEDLQRLGVADAIGIASYLGLQAK